MSENKKVLVTNEGLLAGFDPDKFKQYYDNGVAYLPFKVQLMWFRMKFPNGKIAIKKPEWDSDKSVGVYQAIARVYADAKDEDGEYLAEASAKRGPESKIMDSGESIDPFSACQTAAVSTALRMAGFWCSLTEEDLTRELEQETANNGGEPVTAATATPQTDGPSVKAAQKRGRKKASTTPLPDKTADESSIVIKKTIDEEVPAAGESNVTEEAPAAEESSAAEEAPAAEESSTAEESPAAEESSTAEEAPAVAESNVAEEAPATEESNTAEEAPVVEESNVAEEAPVTDKVSVAEKTSAAVDASTTEDEHTTGESTVVEETPVTEETSPAVGEKSFSEEELSALRSVSFVTVYYKGTVADLENGTREGNEVLTNLFKWLCTSVVALKNPEQKPAAEACRRLAEIYPELLK